MDALLKTKNNLASALRAATKVLDEGRRDMTKKLKTYEVGRGLDRRSATRS